MTPTESPLIIPATYSTRCRLCGQSWTAKPLEPAMNGKPSPRMEKLGNALWEHMVKCHGDIMPLLVIVCSFMLTDPEAIRTVAFARIVAFQSARRHYVPDEVLKDRLARMTTPEEIEAAFMELRDFLTETGKFGPQLPVPSPQNV